jgi:transposase
MMGQPDRSEAVFYYFRLEDQVPESHLLRQIDKHISLAFVREKLKESYSDTGRPWIDPRAFAAHRVRPPFAHFLLLVDMLI